MKLVINRDVLLPALNRVMGAIAAKTTMPILGCVHCVGDGQRLALTGTNLELTLRTTIEFVHEPFMAVWPAKRLYDILKAFPKDGLVGIAIEEDKVTIKCGRSRFVLTTYNPNDFPVIDEGIDFDVAFTLKAKELNALVQRTDFAMAFQDVRYYLNGLCFNGMKEEIRLVATDGHRLAKVSAPVDSGFEEPFEAILPSEAVFELRKVCLLGEDLTVSIRPNLFKFVTEGLTFIAKRLDGRFPEFERVIPKDLEHWIKMDRELLLAALQRIKLVLDKNNLGVRMTIANGNLLLEGIGLENQAEDSLEVQHEGELEIGLNVDYLTDVLRVLHEPEVTIEFRDAESSIKIIEQTGIYIIMPMRL